MQAQEKLKNSRLLMKSQCDDKEAEISDIKKRLNAQQKEINSVQKGITALETKLEQKRADRHSLLKTCKVRSKIIVNRNRNDLLGTVCLKHARSTQFK